ncbi:MAG: hypothetical protein F6J86_38580 [Symploca sp. SIO1B1]|nr:hypothetical protein [Symploca sp. SIO1B1]
MEGTSNISEGKPPNSCQSYIPSEFEGNFSTIIETTRQIAETIDFSLSGVDALQGEGLRGVF